MFKHQPCDFEVEKENIPENSLIYLNQGYQSHKDNKKVYYGDFFIIGQGSKGLNPPEDISTHDFSDREVKTFHLKYDSVSRRFQGLYETIGYIMVRGDADEHFLDYGYLKQNSKFTRNVCRIVSQELFLTDIGYNMSWGLWILDLLKFSIFS